MSNDISLITCPNPLTFERVDHIIPDGQSLYDMIKTNLPTLISENLDAYVYINDVSYVKSDWKDVFPSAGDIVTIRVVPSGGGGKDPARTILMLAVIAAAAWTGPQAAFAVYGSSATSTIGGMVISAGVSMAVTTVGFLAVNALCPPPLSKLDENVNDTFNRSPTLTGGRNRANKYGPIPVILGTHRTIPPYGGNPYTEIVGDDQYIRMLFVVGYGPLALNGFMLGDQRLENMSDVEIEVREGYDTDAAITLYTNDISEEALNVELVEADGFNIETTDQACDEISVDLTFPAGLFTIENDGTKSNATVDLEIQYSVKDADVWSIGNTFEAVGAQESDEMEATAGGEWIRYDRIVINKYTGVISTLTGLEGWGDAGLCINIGKGGTESIPGAKPPTVPDWACSLAKIKRDGTDTIGAADITDERDACLKKQNAGDFLVSEQSPESKKVDIAAGNLQVTPSFVEKRAETIRRTYRFKVARDEYDVRIKRVTVASGDTVIDDVYWTALRAITNEDPITSSEHLAKIALRIKATDQVKGAVDQFSCVATSICPDWNGAAWVTRRTQNPAALFRYVLQHPANAKSLADARIDLTKLQTWHNDCQPTPQNLDNAAAVNKGGGLVGIPCTGHGYEDGETVQFYGTTNYSNAVYVLDDTTSANEMVITATYVAENFAGTETVTNFLFTFGHVYDYRSSVESVLRDIASAGRASPAYVDGTFSVVQDKVQTVPVQHFTPRNSWGYEGSKIFSDIPHAFRVQFLNIINDWREDERIVYDDGYHAGNATLFEMLPLVGIVTPQLAYKHARYHLATARLRPEVHTFSTDVENIVCTRGDLIKFSHDVPLFGVASGRVKAITEAAGELTYITMDSIMPMVGGNDYAIRIRKANGDTVVHNIVTNAGNQTVLELETPAAAHGVAVGDLGQFGEQGSESVDLVVKSIEPGPNLTARLICVDYNAAIYTADTGTIPAYDSQMTLPYNIFEAIGEPIVNTIRSATHEMNREEDGALANQIFVSFTCLTKLRQWKLRFESMDQLVRGVG